MWVYFDSVITERRDIKTDVQRRIEEHALAVGVVAEPEFVEEAGHYDYIFGLATALDAIIWNGNGALNAEGQLLLDGEGTANAHSWGSCGDLRVTGRRSAPSAAVLAVLPERTSGGAGRPNAR